MPQNYQNIRTKFVANSRIFYDYHGSIMALSWLLQDNLL